MIVPEKPALPPDIAKRPKIIEWCEENAHAFRNYSGFIHRSTIKASREALIAILSPEQYAQLYHYGFVEQVVRSGKKYRIHWRKGNRVSAIERDGIASVGLNCFVRTNSEDDTIISNILALRTDEMRFLDKACTEPPFERRVDNEYPYASRSFFRRFCW